MKTIEKPVSIRMYYKRFIDKYSAKKNDCVTQIKKLNVETKALHDTICDSLESYETDLHISLQSYNEFKENRYINGDLLKVAKGIVINKGEDYRLVGTKYDIYNLASQQKQIRDLTKELDSINNLLKIRIKDFYNILRVYYEKVQEKLILDGYGYVLPTGLGYLCIARQKIGEHHRTMIDYAKTKQAKDKLIAEGKIPYNKKDAKFYENHGLEYDGVEYRVFKHDDYIYCWHLVGVRIPNAKTIRFIMADTRGLEIRGKTNDDLYKECNGEIDKIMKLPVDGKTKLLLCLKTDKILYTKYIRNEHQTTCYIKPSFRENRQ